MDFQQPEEFRMLQELVARFIKEHLLPLEPGVLARETGTGLLTLPAEDRTRLDAAAREIVFFTDARSPKVGRGPSDSC